MASTFAAQSPADIVNQAIARIGYKLRVGSLYDGSIAAKKALDLYAQTRDALLRDGDWPFAERNITGNQLKAAPAQTWGGGAYVPPNGWNPVANPPLPWLYEYTFPSDCLKVRAVKPTPVFVPNFNPQPNIFAVLNDNAFTPPQRVVCCNIPNAIIVYTGQITDPTTMPSDFISTLADALGEGLSPVLASLDLMKIKAAETQVDEGRAMVDQG
jgi:hypothetical protein